MDLLLDNIGCIVTVVQTYHPYTQDLIYAYKTHRNPMPEPIYQAWDVLVRRLLSSDVSGSQTYTVELYTEIDPDTGNPRTVYNIPELTDSLTDEITILSVSIEGQGVDQNNPVTIDTTEGKMSYPDAYVDDEGNGQFIKILYKK